MNNGYEYYYLFGLDIPLDKYGLGKIRQPRLIDFIEKDIDISSFYSYFVLNDFFIGQMKEENKEDVLKLKDALGSLGFLLNFACRDQKVKDKLIEALCLLYNTNNIHIHNDSVILVDNILITNDNFDSLCNVVLEMLKIDKSKLKFSSESYDDRVISDKMLAAKKRFMDMNKNKNKKDKSITMIDIANIIVHSCGIDYEKVLNMTIYQIQNSFDIVNAKESYDVNTLYRVSPKFDMSKEKFEHWTEKIKLSKSTLSQND